MKAELERKTLAVLRAKLAAFDQEVQILIAFHEAWRPMVSDTALHERMGASYATHTFEFIRIALRREVLLGLVRLWDPDKRKRAVNLANIGNCVRDRRVVEALVTESVENWGKSPGTRADGAVADHSGEIDKDELTSAGRAWVKEQMAGTLQTSIDNALAIIEKYSDGGSGFATRKNLTGLRNEWLAHRQIKPSTPAAPDRSDEEIETFYQDMLALVEALSHAVNKTAYNPRETALLRQQHSRLFWNGVRGERTEGHPDYRAPGVLP